MRAYSRSDALDWIGWWVGRLEVRACSVLSRPAAEMDGPPERTLSPTPARPKQGGGGGGGSVLGERGHDAAGGSQRAGVAAASLAHSLTRACPAPPRPAPPQFFFSTPTSSATRRRILSLVFLVVFLAGQPASRGGGVLARGQATASSGPPCHSLVAFRVPNRVGGVRSEILHAPSCHCHVSEGGHGA